jgi:hypothetical protein
MPETRSTSRTNDNSLAQPQGETNSSAPTQPSTMPRLLASASTISANNSSTKLLPPAAFHNDGTSQTTQCQRFAHCSRWCCYNSTTTTSDFHSLALGSLTTLPRPDTHATGGACTATARLAHGRGYTHARNTHARHAYAHALHIHTHI